MDGSLWNSPGQNTGVDSLLVSNLIHHSVDFHWHKQSSTAGMGQSRSFRLQDLGLIFYIHRGSIFSSTKLETVKITRWQVGWNN